MKFYAIIDADNLCINKVWADDSVTPEGFDSRTWLETDQDSNVLGMTWNGSAWEETPDTRSYTEKRKERYAPIEDQLDMMYHDAMGGTTTWVDSVTQIKTNIPKE